MKLIGLYGYFFGKVKKDDLDTLRIVNNATARRKKYRERKPPHKFKLTIPRKRK